MKNLLPIIIVLYSFTAFSQTVQRPFVSNLPYTTPINGEFLFAKPAQEITEDDALITKDGHFFNKKGNRVRLLGTTLYSAACFPDSILAVVLAKRFSVLGLNAVRLAAIDNQWWRNYGSVFAEANDSKSFDLNQMKKLDRFIHELKKQGIYIILQVHSQWMPRPEDNIPDYDSIPWNGKYVNYFIPQYINHIRNFTSQLLNHKNTITGTVYKNEPAIAIIELTDDNSLFAGWQNGELHPQSRFSTAHSAILDGVWNGYLKNKYKTTTDLKKAWSIVPDNSKQMPKNGNFEDNNDPLAQWELGVNTDNNAVAAVYPSNGIKKQGNFSAWIKVNKAGKYVYDVLYLNRSVSVKRFQLYELRFWARTDATSPFTAPWVIALQRGAPPYENYGLLYQNDVPLTENWHEYTTRFRSNATDSISTFLSFYLGGGTGNVYIDDISIKALSEEGLIAGESLEAGNVQRIRRLDQSSSVSPARAAEQTLLYTALTDNYMNNFQKLIRDTIGCAALITSGSTPTYINEMYAERNLDFSSAVQSTDYVRYTNDKPSHIGNTGIIQDQYLGAVSYLTRNARINKPHIIGDYQMLSISSHIGEMMSILPVFAQYQDWDGVFVGNLGNDFGKFTWNRLDSNEVWSQTFNSALWALTPSMAECIRTGAIAAAPRQITLNNTAENFVYPTDQLQYGYWLRQYPDSRMSLFRKIRYDSILAKEPSENPQSQIPQIADGTLNTANIISETEELTWNLDVGTLTVNTPRYRSITGRLTGQIFSLGDMRFERTDGGANGNMTWMSYDTTSLEQSQQSLLTLTSRNANANMKWRGDTSVWGGGWGTLPIVSDAMTVRLSFVSNADTVYAIPLDIQGNASKQTIGATRLSGNRRSFSFDQSIHPSLWFLIKQEWIPNSVQETSVSPSITVCPNPVSDYSTITVSLPNSGTSASISIISLTGEVRTIWSGIADGSVLWKDIDNKNFAAGIYKVIVQAGADWQKTSTMVIMK